MIAIKQILPDGHEDLKAPALEYMKSMAERHGFTLLDDLPCSLAIPRTIRINYPFLREPTFLALLEEI